MKNVCISRPLPQLIAGRTSINDPLYNILPPVVSSLETRKELTVLVRNEELIGFANLYDLEPHQSVCIGNVVIGHTFRGAGLGRKPVDRMVEAAFGKYGVQEVRLSVFSENTPARLLYASLGFKPYSIEARQHPTGKRVALIHTRVSRDEYKAHRDRIG